MRVYENGIEGKLLGAFTGDVAPPMLTTSEDELLVVFRSDYTQGSAGFTAQYTIAECPNNCGDDAGVCVGGVCQCTPEYTGDGCETPLCPNNCSQHGTCVTANSTGCVCNDGFKGALGADALSLRLWQSI